MNTSKFGQAFADISVVICVKDRAEDLLLAVGSICDQTIFPREVIIVDDASLEPVSANWFVLPEGITLRIVRNSHNVGAAASCNRGIEEATNEIISFLDSDDCFAENYVEQIINFWRDASLDVVCAPVGFWWCTNELKPYRDQIIRQPVDYKSLLLDGNFVGGNSSLSIRRSAALKFGGFLEVRGSYDLGLLLRLARFGKILTLPECLLFYRSPSTSLLPNETKNFRKQICAIFQVARDQPSDQRLLMRPLLHLRTAQMLAESGRKRLAWGCIRGYCARYGLDRKIVKVVFINGVGRRYFANILRVLANLRAFLHPVPQRIVNVVKKP